MDLLKSIPNPFKTQTAGADAAAANSGEGKSLLADWTAYSAGTRDVESGQQSTAGPTTEVLYQRLGSAAENMSGFFKNSFTRVQSNVQTAATTVSQNLPTSETFSIPSTQQLIYFFCFLGGGLSFLALAFTLFLPMIMLSPSKFAMSFTLGCLLIMIGFFQLRGWKQVQHMLSRERLPFTAAYLGSIVMTLYAALIMHSYLLSLLASGFQVVALVYYVMSYFPGGAQGAKIMLGLFAKAVTNCFTGVTRMVLR